MRKHRPGSERSRAISMGLARAVCARITTVCNLPDPELGPRNPIRSQGSPKNVLAILPARPPGCSVAPTITGSICQAENKSTSHSGALTAVPWFSPKGPVRATATIAPTVSIRSTSIPGQGTELRPAGPKWSRSPFGRGMAANGPSSTGAPNAGRSAATAPPPTTTRSCCCNWRPGRWCNRPSP